jgi:hypothetical protein
VEPPQVERGGEAPPVECVAGVGAAPPVELVAGAGAATLVERAASAWGWHGPPTRARGGAVGLRRRPSPPRRGPKLFVPWLDGRSQDPGELLLLLILWIRYLA